VRNDPQDHSFADRHRVVAHSEVGEEKERGRGRFSPGRRSLRERDTGRRAHHRRAEREAHHPGKNPHETSAFHPTERSIRHIHHGITSPNGICAIPASLRGSKTSPSSCSSVSTSESRSSRLCAPRLITAYRQLCPSSRSSKSES